MKPSNFAPVYACLYPQLTEIARKHGYALATHGSMARDFDLVCIPWIESPSNPQSVVDEMTSTFGIREVGKPETREHGRLIYTLSVKFGECFIDLSFMPTHPAAEPVAWMYPHGLISYLGDKSVATPLFTTPPDTTAKIADLARRATDYAWQNDQQAKQIADIGEKLMVADYENKDLREQITKLEQKLAIAEKALRELVTDLGSVSMPKAVKALADMEKLNDK